MPIIIRARLTAPPNAIQRLAEALRDQALPPDWSFAARPTTIVLSAPAPMMSPDQQGYAGEVVVKVAKARDIVGAACDRRDDIRLSYFAVDPANGL